MLSSANPFQIHDENQHVSIRASSTKVGPSKTGLGLSKKAICEDQPLKPTLSKTTKPSTRKALGELSTAQLNSRSNPGGNGGSNNGKFKILVQSSENNSSDVKKSSTMKTRSRLQQAEPVVATVEAKPKTTSNVDVVSTYLITSVLCSLILSP